MDAVRKVRDLEHHAAVCLLDQQGVVHGQVPVAKPLALRVLDGRHQLLEETTGHTLPEAAAVGAAHVVKQVPALWGGGGGTV